MNIHGVRYEPTRRRLAPYLTASESQFSCFWFRSERHPSWVQSGIFKLVENEKDNRVLINVCATYNARVMAIQIKNYFNANLYALEVLIYKGKKTISVTRRFVENSMYLILFRQKYLIAGSDP